MLMRLVLVLMVISTVFGRAVPFQNLNARDPSTLLEGRNQPLETTPPSSKDLNVITLPLSSTPATNPLISASTTQNSKSNPDTNSNQNKIPTKQSAHGGIGPPPPRTGNHPSLFQRPDMAQFGIGTPPDGFQAPTKKKGKKKGKAESNSDLNSAPF